MIHGPYNTKLISNQYQKQYNFMLFVCTFIFNSSVTDVAGFNNSNSGHCIITFSLLACIQPGDTFNSLICDIHLKRKFRRDGGSLAIDKIIR